MNDWIRGNLHTDVTKYITDSQVHITNHTRKATNELMNQGVKIDGIQYYNTHQESIILDLVTESDIYNNYRYASCVNWEINKTPGTHPKKLEFKIDKPEANLKNIDSNINVNDNEIDDMNKKEAVHPSDYLPNDDYSNTLDDEIQHK